MPSFRLITPQDLSRLQRLAQTEREEYVSRHPELTDRLTPAPICTVLTGQAANHFNSGMSGFAEFELHSFFAEIAGGKSPRIRRSCLDFGPSRHGREDAGSEAYKGRRVWFNYRFMEALNGRNELDALQQYLSNGGTPTARTLRANTVVMIEPDYLLGLIAWPTLVVTKRGRRQAAG